MEKPGASEEQEEAGQIVIVDSKGQTKYTVSSGMSLMEKRGGTSIMSSSCSTSIKFPAYKEIQCFFMKILIILKLIYMLLVSHVLDMSIIRATLVTHVEYEHNYNSNIRVNDMQKLNSKQD